MLHTMRGWRPAALVAMLTAVAGCSLLPESAKTSGDDAASEPPRISATVTGVDDALAQNIHAHLGITSKPCTAARAYLETLTERAREETTNALRALGYYSPDITLSLDTTGACPALTVAVTPGPPVVLDKVDIEILGDARDDAEFLRQTADHGLRTGRTLDHGVYEAAKRLLETVALERGYLEAMFTRRRLRVDPATHTARVSLRFDSGPRYALGDIVIRQEPDFLSEALVRRFLEQDPGAAYDAATVSRFHLALSKSAYFDRVDVRPRLSRPDGETIPIDITLSPRDRHAFSAGLGASTDEGVRGRFGYENRRVNRHGHQLDLSINTSMIEQQFSVGYRLPRAHPIDEWLRIQAGIRRRDVDSFDTIESQLLISDTKRRPWRWLETRFIELNREDYDVSGTNDVSLFLSPGVTWRRTVTNDDLFPTRGYDIEFELKGAAEAVISDTSFTRSVLRVGAVRGLPWRSRALIRGHLGAMWVDDFARLPPSERFFAGGDNSIRGYDIESLGPVDASNDVIGGTYLAVVSVELEHYFTDSWGVAVFADTGNAYGGDGSASGLQTGAGIGVRWRTPVGPVRIDLAHPLNDDDNAYRFHLRIGPDL